MPQVDEEAIKCDDRKSACSSGVAIHPDDSVTSSPTVPVSETTAASVPGPAATGRGTAPPPPPIRRHFGLKAKFKPNVVAAAAERHRLLVGDSPQR
jgi:hypothetical protein